MSKRKKITIAVALAAALCIIAGAAYAYTSHQKALEISAYNESVQSAYDEYMSQYKGITDAITEEPGHDELVKAIVDLNAFTVDKESLKLYDGSYLNGADVVDMVEGSLSECTTRLTGWYSSELDAAAVDIENASKDDINAAIEKLNALKDTIAADSEATGMENGAIVTAIDSDVQAYSDKVAEIEEEEAKAAEEAAKAQQQQASNYSNSSSYSSNGYSGGSNSGSSSSSEPQNDGWRPEGEGWRYSDKYGGIWMRKATPEEIQEAKDRAGYTGP